MFAVSDVIDGERIQITKRRYVVVSTTVNSNGVVVWWQGQGNCSPWILCWKICFQKYKIWNWKSPSLGEFREQNRNFEHLRISSVGHLQLSVEKLQISFLPQLFKPTTPLINTATHPSSVFQLTVTNITSFSFPFDQSAFQELAFTNR